MVKVYGTSNSESPERETVNVSRQVRQLDRAASETLSEKIWACLKGSVGCRPDSSQEHAMAGKLEQGVGLLLWIQDVQFNLMRRDAECLGASKAVVEWRDHMFCLGGNESCGAACELRRI